MLVLAGPQGAGKQGLALKLVEEFPDYFGYGSVWEKSDLVVGLFVIKFSLNHVAVTMIY